MMDATEKSFDFANDISKLLITMASGIITFTVAFFDKDATMRPTEMVEKWILISTWVVLLLSAVVGIWTQLALTTELDPPEKPEPFQPTIRRRRVTVPYRLQIISFVVGVMATIIYGACKLF